MKNCYPSEGVVDFGNIFLTSQPKYGIKIFAVVDSRTFYTSDMEIYAGIQPEGQFRSSNRPIDIVKRLMQPLYKTGRNLTTNNWYTSYPLAKDLLNEKITLVGTLRKDKREIPEEFTVAKGREVNSSVFGFQKDITAVSYIPKKGKCVVLLSSMHNDDAIDTETGNKKKKPEIISFYNLTKGAVDVVDEIEANYSAARITNRWPMVIFYSILNIAAINARIILHSTKTPPLQHRSRRLFLKDLALGHIKNFIDRRSQQENLPKECRKRCLNACNNEKDENESASKKKAQKSRGRCYICPRNKDKKSSTACVTCEKVCAKNTHLVYVKTA
ncbi:piggyBac transposable element-derived protein 4-like [Parasteatoda tepidariorum]|uniref:piggyBac transposable element-derived protein 4-like n=1 Tax=Parasteatoda tepidariorum TaxID=114398 RepID=UPI0039BCF498